MSLAPLVAALPHAPGCGPDLALTPAFDAIARMREEEDARLAQGEWRRAPRVADWPGVRRACAELLASATKDLRLAGWWTEAAARLDGPAGLADGLEMACALTGHGGDALHPAIVGEDVDARVAALRWLLLHVERLAAVAPLLRIGRHAVGTAAVAAARRRGDDDAAASGGDDGPPGLQAILRAAREAGAGGLGAARTAWQRADASLLQLQALADARLGTEAPSFTAAREAVAAADAATAALAHEAGVDLAPGGAAGGRALGAATGPTAPLSEARASGAPADSATTTHLLDASAERTRSAPESTADAAGELGADSGRGVGSGSAFGASVGRPCFVSEPAPTPGQPSQAACDERPHERPDDPALASSCPATTPAPLESPAPTAPRTDDDAHAIASIGSASNAPAERARETPHQSLVCDGAPAAPRSAGERGGAWATAPAAADRIAGREEALALLQAAGTYFRTAEPHSPVGYLVDKALRWASMPLHLWLREVLRDEAAIARIDDTLGTAAAESPRRG